MKKLTAVIVLLLTLMSTGINSFATGAGGNASNSTSISITAPKDEVTVTTNEKILLAGLGSPNDTLKIQLFTKNGNDYTTLRYELNIVLESIGNFNREIQLYPGDNKIVATITGKNGEAKEVRFVRYNRITNTDINNLIKSMSLGNTINNMNGQ